jgi:hypothetical protein
MPPHVLEAATDDTAPKFSRHRVAQDPRLAHLRGAHLAPLEVGAEVAHDRLDLGQLRQVR